MTSLFQMSSIVLFWFNFSFIIMFLSAHDAVSANRIAGWVGLLPQWADTSWNGQEGSEQYPCRNTWWYVCVYLCVY